MDSNLFSGGISQKYVYLFQKKLSLVKIEKNSRIFKLPNPKIEGLGFGHIGSGQSLTFTHVGWGWGT